MAGLTKKQLTSTNPKPLGLKDFYKKRNKVLIWHDKGGLGDVLMQRMMFQDFRNACPDVEFTFACLPEYIEAAKDHPDIKNVVDSRHVNLEEYGIHYNTCVTIADRYENIHAPFCKEHRSDIWAKYCGVTLNNHDMNIQLCRKNMVTAQNKLNKLIEKQGPIVLFAPISKMLVKSLLPWQIETITNAVLENVPSAELIGIHNREIAELKGIYDSSLQEWMHLVSMADYVIAVDTASFHLAGGLRKPLMGIFTFADGKAYGKYFDFILVQKHRDNGNWACGPCFKFASCPKSSKPLKPCLTELSEQDLKNGVKKMFEKWPWKQKISQ